ncbi:efflux RND transporter permease subunit [Zwartia panacis]|uniref:efflux RND transporter permease subunit n=1 Tax=Zwartia panacis TaxID=2683345 RepID=UPI0025B320F9|nr:efflux RND transporter permease subunit [Zwartia panacis]MDN4017480.1 efflux RND transporter permease subunit [Zwartia panacis]
MLSKFFIERPVLGNVIALITMLIGAVSILGLPIAQYPPMTPPTVQVTTMWPGASASLVQQLVASNIENQVNGVENMLYMQSDSTNDGRYTLTVTFEVGTDPNMAQVTVQNRVAIALASLPQAVQKQGVTTKVQSTSILQFVTLTSSNPEHDALFLSNFANLQLQNRLARIPGVAAANVFGVGNYSMRIWLDPAQLKMRNLTPTDVATAISRQNVMLAAGQVGAPPVPMGQDFQLTLNVTSALETPEQFEQILLKTNDQGELTRLKDVARVEMGSQNYSQFFRLGDKPAGGIAIYQLPAANAIDVAKAVRAEMDKISKTFPKEIKWEIPFDTTMFVTASITEVYHTLFEAGILVLLVIMLFLQDWRATLVPATTVPVTIIGAFACMAAMGFSINLLTLFAIVLCIGIVVDDAIVVVEGVAKKVELGQTPRQGAISAMNELLGPIIGITLVLMAVFLPASFIAGITGQMYRQFALVIAATALISGINAVTLKPTQAAQFITPKLPGAKKNWFFVKFDQVFERISDWYANLMHHLMDNRKITSLVGIVLIIGAIIGLIRLPTGFIPNEDQGYLVVSVQLPDAASLTRTQAGMAKVVTAIEKVPGVQQVVSIGGVNALSNNSSQSNTGVMYVILKPWEARGKVKGEDLKSIYAGMSEAIKSIQEVSANVLLPPAIPGLGLSGGFQMQLQLIDGSNDFKKLEQITEEFLQQARARPEIMAIFTPFRNNVPQLKLTFNPSRAETLGVSLGDAYDVLQSSIGSTYVNQFFKYGQTYQVFLQADGKSRVSPDQINRLYVKNKSGNMVPLGSFIEITETTGPAIASQYNIYPTAAILGAAADGYSSGQVITALEELARTTLPESASFEWTAMSYQEKLVGNTVVLVFALSILLVYLVLAAQYESWSAPISVILAVPLALVGTVIALSATGLANNIYVQIGLVLMIALASKNAILIVEVALEERKKGLSPVEAALKASHERFRPIVMTSIAFILGVVPLLTASGAGAAARVSIGITVFSGMIASTCLAVALVPVFYVEIQTWVEKRQAKHEAKAAARLAAHERAMADKNTSQS